MKYVFAFLGMLLSLGVQAQHKLSGNLSDETTTESLIFAEILLVGEGIDVTNITDENGYYIFEDLPGGTYNLKVIYNLDTIYSDQFQLNSDLEKSVKLKINEVKLDEVVLTKKVFQKKSDRFIFDVAASPIAKGTDAFQLLQETPLVSSTDGKSLKILGKSAVVIYINGKKSNMDAESIIEMLKNTSAEQIQKIEVITVPGSEFQTEANDGVINIVMKKSGKDGFNGTVRLLDNQGYYNNPRGNVALNLRQNKLAVNTNFYLGTYKEKEYFELSNGNANFRNESEGFSTDPNTNVGGSVNIDYELTPKQNLGFTYNMRYNKSFNSTLDIYNTYDGILSNRNLKTEDAQTRNHSFNLNYEIKTDTLGSKLVSNISYLWFNRNMEAKNETFPLNGGSYKAFRQFVPQEINNVGGNIDYILKTEKENTWLFGGNYNYTQTDNDTRQDNLTETGYVNDFALSNHFKYRENILGLYLAFEKQFNEKLSGKIGTRFENTMTKGEIIGKDTSFEKDYSNFLPYMSLNYAVNSDHNLSYSFSSRIRRPAFWELNPSRTYFTPTNYIQNNPFMLSSRYYNQELNYMFKSSYFVILGFEYKEDASSQLPLQGKVREEATGIETDFLRYIRTNYGDNKQFNLTLGMNKGFFGGIWNTNYSVNLFYEIFRGTVNEDPTYVPQPGFTETLYPYIVDSENLGLYLQVNNTIRLSSNRDWFLGVNYWYLAPKNIELGKLKQLHSFDVNIKKIWNNWTFMIEGTDLFDMNREIIEGMQPNGDFNNVSNYEYNRQINVIVTYTFGNQKLKKAREVDSANSSIKSRM